MRRMIDICIGLVLIAATSMPVEAGVYRWTDANGKVHFGDRRPGDANVTSLDLPDTSNSQEPTSFTSPRHVATNKPIKLTSDTRRVKFDKVMIDLSDDTESRHTIGRSFYGNTCKSSPNGKIYLKHNHAELNGKSYKSHFAKLLKKNGYKVIDDDLQIFAGMEREAEELQVAAIIKELTVNRCYRNNTAKQINIADYMRVEWKVYDPLNRTIIYETTSEGSSRETYDKSNQNEVGFSGIGAFRSATSNLLAKSDFVDALNRKTPEIIATSTTPLAIKLSYAHSKQSFTEQVDHLKEGTVTVRSPHGHGSGFVISSDGYVITNSHVVGKASEVLVIAGEQRSKAHIVRQDFHRDVALLKLDDHTVLPALALAKNGIGVGHSVYLIGTPLDESLGHTITRGIISAERRREDNQRYYQTDAAVNPGNSGGPAFSEQGEVVGITVSGLFGSSGGSLNINFLIPIDEAINALQIQGGVKSTN